MSPAEIFFFSLPYGLLLSLLLTVLIVTSFAIAPDMWVGDYPGDIRRAFGEKSARARRWQPWVASVFFGTLIAVVAACLRALDLHISSDPGFADYYLASLVVLMTFNLFDLLVLDWLVFVAWQPRWIILPGTEGMAGYRDYRFHFVAFLKGSVAMLVVSIPFALVASLAW